MTIEPARAQAGGVIAAVSARIWRAGLAAAGPRSWALIFGLQVLTVFSGGLVWIVWKGPWALDRQTQQLEILGFSLFGVLMIVAIGFIALAGLGVAASISKTGASLTVGDDDHAPDQVTVATHTETTVTAQPAPPPAASA